MNTKLRLIVMNFLQFAVWGAYLTSMGTYLFNAGLASKIGLFYACQGIVSMFMPAIIGIIADRYVQAQKMLGICHTLAAAFMLGADAIQVGTRFLSALECNVHQEYKDKVLKATDVSTIVTGKSLGHPVRSLKTPFSRTFSKMENDPSVDHTVVQHGTLCAQSSGHGTDENNAQHRDHDARTQGHIDK